MLCACYTRLHFRKDVKQVPPHPDGALVLPGLLAWQIASFQTGGYACCDSSLAGCGYPQVRATHIGNLIMTSDAQADYLVYGPSI